jgi:hypothetical protein
MSPLRFALYSFQDNHLAFNPNGLFLGSSTSEMPKAFQIEGDSPQGTRKIPVNA